MGFLSEYTHVANKLYSLFHNINILMHSYSFLFLFLPGTELATIGYHFSNINNIGLAFPPTFPILYPPCSGILTLIQVSQLTTSYVLCSLLRENSTLSNLELHYLIA